MNVVGGKIETSYCWKTTQKGDILKPQLLRRRRQIDSSLEVIALQMYAETGTWKAWISPEGQRQLPFDTSSNLFNAVNQFRETDQIPLKSDTDSILYKFPGLETMVAEISYRRSPTEVRDRVHRNVALRAFADRMGILESGKIVIPRVYAGVSQKGRQVLFLEYNQDLLNALSLQEIQIASSSRDGYLYGFTYEQLQILNAALSKKEKGFSNLLGNHTGIWLHSFGALRDYSASHTLLLRDSLKWDNRGNPNFVMAIV